jgi:hypothetical protein
MRNHVEQGHLCLIRQRLGDIGFATIGSNPWNRAACCSNVRVFGSVCAGFPLMWTLGASSECTLNGVVLLNSVA